MRQFREVFYLSSDRAAQQAMLDPAPIPKGNVQGDAWIGNDIAKTVGAIVTAPVRYQQRFLVFDDYESRRIAEGRPVDKSFP